MKIEYIVRNQSRELLLFFAGWGMDKEPFKHIKPDNKDFAIVYDYSDMSFDSKFLNRYNNVKVVAWSLGVFAASCCQMFSPGKIDTAIAINGTPFGVDKKKGIDPEMVQKTIDALDEENLKKFYKRMCGSQKSFEKFMLNAPKRSIDDIKKELIKIKQNSQKIDKGFYYWTNAYIGSSDKIFPPFTQFFGFGSYTKKSVRDMNHYEEAFFKLILK